MSGAAGCPGGVGRTVRACANPSHPRGILGTVFSSRPDSCEHPLSDTIDLGTLRSDDAPFRFLHAADLHLGASDHVQAALDNLVATAVDRSVDAVALAGDVYDAADRSPNLQVRFVGALRVLHEAGIPVFIAHGNHDPVAATFRPVVGALPDNVHVFGPGDPQTYRMRVGAKSIAITGVSFENDHDKTNLAARIAATAIDAHLRIAVVHANVDGQPGHDPYGPCTQDDLRDSDIDYWALGHIHNRTVKSMGSGRWWVYPGNLQGRSLKPAECGPKGVIVVAAGAVGFDEPEFVSCDVHRFIQLEIDLAGVEHYEDAVDRVVGQVTETFDAQHADRGVLRGMTTRIAVRGATDVHDDLTNLTPAVVSEILADPRIRIDRIVRATQRPVDRAALAASDSFIGNMLRRIDALRNGPADVDELFGRIQDLSGSEAIRRAKELLDRDQLGRADLLDRVDQLVLDAFAGVDR